MSNYRAEKIVDKRQGTVEYQVKWVGFSKLTWEPIENLTAGSINLFQNPTKTVNPSDDDDEEDDGDEKFEVEMI